MQNGKRVKKFHMYESSHAERALALSCIVKSFQLTKAVMRTIIKINTVLHVCSTWEAVREHVTMKFVLPV